MSAPADLAEKLFRALYADFDLITVNDVYIAVPSDGTILAFCGSTLAELAGQISEKSTSTMPDPRADTPDELSQKTGSDLARRSRG
jgi:hypothetical protein